MQDYRFGILTFLLYIMKPFLLGFFPHYQKFIVNKMEPLPCNSPLI